MKVTKPARNSSFINHPLPHPWHALFVDASFLRTKIVKRKTSYGYGTRRKNHFSPLSDSSPVSLVTSSVVEQSSAFISNETIGRDATGSARFPSDQSATSLLDRRNFRPRFFTETFPLESLAVPATRVHPQNRGTVVSFLGENIDFQRRYFTR